MLAILGGTGPEGKGLALRLAMAGEAVTIGSRSTERGAAAAAELAEGAPGASIEGTDNAGAAAAGEVVFLAFPYEGQRPVLEELASSLDGKIVVSVIAPMVFERGKGARAVEVEAGSAAQEAQEILPGAQVVAAFQNVSAEELQDPGRGHGGRRGGVLRPRRRQEAGDWAGRQDPKPARRGRRGVGQRQVRGADHAAAGEHQPDLPDAFRREDHRRVAFPTVSADPSMGSG